VIANGVSAARGGTPDAAGSWQLAAPEAGGFRPVYRRRMYLRLRAGGQARAAVVNAAAARLAGSFSPLDRDVRTAPVGVTLAGADGSTVRAEFPVPARVLRVHLNPAPPAGRTVQLFRLDGNTPGPTAAAVAASGAAFGAEVVDLRLALRLASDAVTFHPLAPVNVQQLWVRTFPSSPRLLLAPADDSGASSVLWTAPGEVGRQQPLSAGQFDLREPFAAALARVLDALPAPLPAMLDLLLTAESDAPCTFALTAVSAGGHLVRGGFAAEEKAVLRFEGTGAERREVALQVARGATVRAARLEMEESLRQARPGDAAGGGSGGGGSADAPGAGLDAGRGASLAGARWAAQSFTPARATLASGVSVGVLPLQEGTEVRVELREDFGGEPEGRVLASGTVPAGVAGRRGWASLSLATPVLLAVQPYWLVLSTPNGGGVWLARDVAGSRMRVGQAPEPGALPLPEGTLDGLQALHRLLERPVEPLPGPSGAPGVTVSPAPPPLTVEVAGAVLRPAEASGRLGVDLASALTAAAASAPGSDPLVTVPVVLTAAVPGLVTVYPPSVEYTLPF
jgi:hypothetical protein